MFTATKYICSRKKQNLRPVQLAITRWSTVITTVQENQFDGSTLAAAKPFESIPSFTKFPIIGTAWVYFPFIGRYDFRKLNLAMKDKRARLGSIFRERIGPSNIVVSFNPEDLHTLFTHQGMYPSRGVRISSMRVYRESRKQLFTTMGLLEMAFKYINRSLDELKASSNEDKNLAVLQTMLMEKDLDLSEVIVIVLDLIFGGVDTPSNTMVFFFYHMAKFPEKQDLLRKEIKSLLPRKEDRITTETINELRYLKACMKESQRLQPVGQGITRCIDHDIVLSGYQVPAGTSCFIALPEIYLDEKYYTHPLKYYPERWLQRDEKFHPFAFSPFGLGLRNCVGKKLFELEAISVITEIIRKFRIEYHHEDIGIRTNFVNTPDRPLNLRFVERQN